MLDTCFIPFPVLATERLVLRQLEAADAGDIFAHRSDDVVNTYLEDFRHASLEASQAYIDRVLGEIGEGRTIFWVLSRKEERRFMGAISLWNIVPAKEKAEIGYTLSSGFHRQGYMQEALKRVIHFGFHNMKLKTIDAYTHEHNEASIRLLRRYGFQQGSPQKPVSANRIFFSLEQDRFLNNI